MPATQCSCHAGEATASPKTRSTAVNLSSACTQIRKPDMVATKALKQAGVVPPRCLGHPRGVQPGDRLEGRGELDALSVHSLAVQGIDYSKDTPAFAICLSGGYVDDVDTGKIIRYTGMGGQKDKRQVKDQELRVVRSAADHAAGSPSSASGGMCAPSGAWCACLSYVPAVT